MRYDGKVALITGAGRGIGREHADGVQQQAEGRQDLGRGLKDAGHQQQLAHRMPPPVMRRGNNAIIICINTNGTRGQQRPRSR